MAGLRQHIWKQLCSIEQLNSFMTKAHPHKTILHTLGIQYTKIGDNYLEATMPVDHRTHQPYGILHGGASVVLAESLGSFASVLVAGADHLVVGIEVSASHLRSVKSGSVTGRATPLRLGKSLHVWEINIHETGKEDDGLVCHSKLTVMVKPSHTKHA
jgi:uncharacterized protein (TIGR00369 family)